MNANMSVVHSIINGGSWSGVKAQAELEYAA